MRNTPIFFLVLFIAFCSLAFFDLTFDNKLQEIPAHLVSSKLPIIKQGYSVSKVGSSLMDCPEIINTNIQNNGNNFVGDSINIQVSGYHLPSEEKVKWFIDKDSGFNPANGEGIPIGEKGFSSDLGSDVTIMGLLLDACEGGNQSEIQNEFIVCKVNQQIKLFEASLIFDNSVKDNQPENSDIDGFNCVFQIPNNAAEIQANTSCTINFVDANDEIPPNSILIILTSNNTYWDYNFNTACNLGLNVYVTQNSCKRTLEAFPNLTNSLVKYSFRGADYSPNLSYARPSGASNITNRTALLVSFDDNLALYGGSCNPNLELFNIKASKLLVYYPPATLCEGEYFIKGYFESNVNGCEEIYFTETESFYFNNSSLQIGASCDDGNPNTTNDVIQTDCNCLGIINYRDIDSLVLTSLYNATHENGDWTKEWKLLEPMTTWTGVELNGQGRVVKLDLEDNKLSGIIPDSIGLLEKLEHMNLSRNDNISGGIPKSIGNLDQLIHLDLRYNLLSGEIPIELTRLSNLQLLFLSYNNLTGEIPSTLGQLKNLSSLLIIDNLLSGSIPKSIGELKNLRTLSLSSNNLSDSIPGELGTLPILESLFLSGNNLSGPIPNSIGNLQNLVELSLSNNNISDPIPNSLGNLTNLSVLKLQNNSLSGPLPESLGNLPNITTIYLQNNNLSGCFPATYSSFCTLAFSTNSSQEGQNFTGNESLADNGGFNAFCNNGTGQCREFPCSLEEIIDQIPKSFAPNSTISANKFFDPLAPFTEADCPINLTETQLTIFNRYGNILYQPNPYEPWDGTINGNGTPAAPSTYYYTLKIGTANQEIIKGAINLIEVQ